MGANGAVKATDEMPIRDGREVTPKDSLVPNQRLQPCLSVDADRLAEELSLVFPRDILEMRHVRFETVDSEPLEDEIIRLSVATSDAPNATPSPNRARRLARADSEVCLLTLQRRILGWIVILHVMSHPAASPTSLVCKLPRPDGLRTRPIPSRHGQPSGVLLHETLPPARMVMKSARP